MRLFAPTISPCLVLASIGWSVALGIIVADVIWIHSATLGDLGLLIAGASGALNMKSWLIAGEHRERELFNVGRESGLRSVDAR